MAATSCRDCHVGLCPPRNDTEREKAGGLSFRPSPLGRVEKSQQNRDFCHCEAEQGSAVAISPLKKEQKRGKIIALILSIIFLFTALVGGSVFLIVNHITKTTATTESPTLTTNLFTTSGTINEAGVRALLNVVGTDTGTYTAHEIASDGKSVIFPMGYYVSSSGTMDTTKTLYWQATYKRGGYLTIWLTTPYTKG
ncbi:MAG: hypothetical protein IJ301_02775, partial [Clostridia bacterium]|nr:hypothetical protein [Clostridia bacterium]